MKKLFILAMFFAFFIGKNNAQISSGVNLGTLITDGESIFGLSLNGKYELNKKLKVGANLGYFSKKYEFFGTSVRSSIMPITGLVEYKIVENILNPYAGMDLGFYRFGVAGFSAMYLGLAPTAGINYDIDSKLSVNANFKYHYILSSEITSASILNVNAGISYKLK